MSLKGHDRMPVAGVPDLRGLVRGRRDDALAIEAEGGGRRPSSPLKLRSHASRQRPKSARSCRPKPSLPAAIGTEGGGCHHIVMSFENSDQRSGLRVSKSAREPPSDAVKTCRLSGLNAAEGHQVPHALRTAIGAPVAACQRRAVKSLEVVATVSHVGAEGGKDDVFGMTLERHALMPLGGASESARSCHQAAVTMSDPSRRETRKRRRRRNSNALAQIRHDLGQNVERTRKLGRRLVVAVARPCGESQLGRDDRMLCLLRAAKAVSATASRADGFVSRLHFADAVVGDRAPRRQSALPSHQSARPSHTA